MDVKNNSLFVEIFKDLEDYLNRLVGFIPKKGQDKKNFGDLVEESKIKNPLINTYVKDLKDYNQIRNLLEHEKKGDRIMVLDSEIAIFKRMVENIKNPPTVYVKFKRNVFTCQTSELLPNVLKIMKEKTYTHIPVYDEDKFIGILSEVSVTNWLVEKKNINLEITKIADLMNYLNNQPNEFFEFVKKDENAFIVREWFYTKVRTHKRLGAVFITENGNKNEPLLGVVTAWDLPELDLSKRNDAGDE